jgi:putative ABC transport system permease protein
VNRLRALVAPLAVARRRLRADPLFAGALFLATAATAFLFALVPQLFDRMAETSLEQTVARADPAERNLAITRAGRIPAAAGADPVASVTASGAAYERRLPRAYRAVIGARRTTVDSVRYTLVAAPGEREPAGTTRYLTLRYLPDATDRVGAAQGALPTDEAGPVEVPFGGQATATGLEIALSRTAARQLSLELGDRIFALPAADDPLVRSVPVGERRYLALVVVGFLAGRDERDSAWIRESQLDRATIRDTETRRFASGHALLAREAYNELLAGTGRLPLRYQWQYLVDPAEVARADHGRLAADVRMIEAVFGRTSFGQRIGLGARTGLVRILERFEANREAAGAVLAVGGIALLSVALTVLGFLAALAAERRAEAIALLRSRGGSLAQTLTAQAVEGLLVAVPAGALGYVVATLAVGRSPGLLPVLLVLGIVLTAAALLAGVAAGPALRALAVKGRDDVAVSRPSPRRLALEGSIVLAALAGTYLLRRRGLSAEGGFDPYLAAVPVLGGLAVGLLALRLYPLPLAGLAWAAGRRRDLVPVLGLRRLARGPALAAAPLLVVLLASSVGVFAATIARALEAAQDDAGGSRLTSLDTGTVDVFRAGIAVAGAYEAIALVLAPVLTARPLLRDFARLRAIGLSRRDVLRLTAFEVGPPVGVALVIGIVLGVVLAYLVEPGIDLAALAAGERAALRPPLVAPALLVLALVLVTAGASLATGLAARRADLSRVLRTGER